MARSFVRTTTLLVGVCSLFLMTACGGEMPAEDAAAEPQAPATESEEEEPLFDDGFESGDSGSWQEGGSEEESDEESEG